MNHDRQRPPESAYFSGFRDVARDPDARSLSFFRTCSTADLDQHLLAELKRIGLEEGKNVRISLHPSPEADLHNMIIFQHRGTPFPPHKHPRKSEAYQIIEGALELAIFDNEGQVIKRYDMAAKGTVVMRISRDCFHALVPKTPYVIFQETRTGPFHRETDTVFLSAH